VGFCDHSNEHSGYIKFREYLDHWSRNSSVGIVTSHGQDGPVCESRQGRQIGSSITVHTIHVLYFNGFGRSFLGYSDGGVTTTRLHELKMSGAIRLLPLYALMTWLGT
jgi:hypothetical protein